MRCLLYVMFYVLCMAGVADAVVVAATGVVAVARCCVLMLLVDVVSHCWLLIVVACG